jgi:hypothetical protein
MNMSTQQSISPYIKFQRNTPEWLFHDSKLFTLIAYCAKRARRSKESIVLQGDGTVVELNVGEFIIGRHAVTRDTDLSVQQYRTRWKRMQKLGLISEVKVTNQYTVGKLESSDIFDINSDPTNQPTTSQWPIANLQVTTNKNDNNEKNEKNAAATQVSENGDNLKDRASIDVAFNDYLEARATQAKPGNPQGFKISLLKQDRPVFQEVFDLIQKMRITSADASSDDMQVADKASRLMQAYSRELDDYPAAMSSHIRKWLKNHN